MSEFTPIVGILPGHPAEPASADLLHLASSLQDHAVNAFVPVLPELMMQHGDQPLAPTTWEELSGWPEGLNQIRAHDELLGNLARSGVNALLIVNRADQIVQDSVGRGIVHNAVSDRITSAALYTKEVDGVPVALTRPYRQEGGNQGDGPLARRMRALQRLGATMVGEDPADIAAFLAEHVRPGITVTVPPAV